MLDIRNPADRRRSWNCPGSTIGIEQTVDKLINESSPDDLRKWNEQTLSELGANRDLIAQFLAHPWDSPRQETIITAALRKTQVDPNLFLETANKALTDQNKEDTSNASPNCSQPTHKKSRHCNSSAFRTDFFARSTATGCSLFRCQSTTLSGLRQSLKGSTRWLASLGVIRTSRALRSGPTVNCRSV